MTFLAALVAQWIEYCPPKAGVVGSIPAERAISVLVFPLSIFPGNNGFIRPAQLLHKKFWMADFSGKNFRTNFFQKLACPDSRSHPEWLPYIDGQVPLHQEMIMEQTGQKFKSDLYMTEPISSSYRLL